jgi:hypothetical protein
MRVAVSTGELLVADTDIVEMFGWFQLDYRI